MAGGSSTPSTPLTCMTPTSGGRGAGHRECALLVLDLGFNLFSWIQGAEPTPPWALIPTKSPFLLSLPQPPLPGPSWSLPRAPVATPRGRHSHVGRPPPYPLESPKALLPGGAGEPALPNRGGQGAPSSDRFKLRPTSFPTTSSREIPQEVLHAGREHLAAGGGGAQRLQHARLRAEAHCLGAARG